MVPVLDQQEILSCLARPSRPTLYIVIPPPERHRLAPCRPRAEHSIQDILIRWRRMQGPQCALGARHRSCRDCHAERGGKTAPGRRRRPGNPLDASASSSASGNGKPRPETPLSVSRNGSVSPATGTGCDSRWTRGYRRPSGSVRRLYEDGLIYRGERLINWCPRCLTALSDIEVEHEEIKGKLYHDPLSAGRGSNDPSHRGDHAAAKPCSAIPPWPSIPRRSPLSTSDRTTRSVFPLTTRTIPIVGDAILVDREFGTGAVKITPAHDFNDFEAGERHGLRAIFDL